jgi:hypothetical protein
LCHIINGRVDCKTFWAISWLTQHRMAEEWMRVVFGACGRFLDAQRMVMPLSIGFPMPTVHLKPTLQIPSWHETAPLLPGCRGRSIRDRSNAQSHFSLSFEVHILRASRDTGMTLWTLQARHSALSCQYQLQIQNVPPGCPA